MDNSRSRTSMHFAHSSTCGRQANTENQSSAFVEFVAIPAQQYSATVVESCHVLPGVRAQYENFQILEPTAQQQQRPTIMSFRQPIADDASDLQRTTDR